MMVEIDICRLRPPEPPLFTSTSDASRKRIESIQRNSTVYQDYLKTCGGGNGTLPGLPQASSSTPAQTTIVSTPVTTLQYVTTEVTNITSSQNDTFLPPNISNLATSSSSDDWVVPVVVVVVVISILVIIVAVIVFLMKKHKERFLYLYQNIPCYTYKAPPTGRHRKESLSSVESKKSGSILGSLGEIQQNGKRDPVVFTNQVSIEEVDFKHSSTAQLIDETMLVEQNSNTLIDASNVFLEMNENAYEQSSTQNDTHDKQTKTVQPDLDDYQQIKTSESDLDDSAYAYDVLRDNTVTGNEKSDINPPNKEMEEMLSEQEGNSKSALPTTEEDTPSTEK